MISRRNIRIKVMQTLYSLGAFEIQNTDEEQNKNMVTSAQRQMRQHLEQANQIFIHLLYTLCEIARYADIDARQRASKHLPSPEDLQVNTKIARNSSILRLMEDHAFNSRVKEVHSKEITDMEIIRELYHELTRTPQYQGYIGSSNENAEADKKIIQFLFNELLMKKESFDQYMEDTFLHWPDDRGMMKILVNNYLNKPWLFNFKQLLSNEKQNYAMELLRTVLDKKPYCLELIRPRLQNWDPDRVAVIDMLLLFMGVCEFLYFPTIPTKVTINEYIDLAKVYSTPQSGQFINGILDNVLRDLQINHKIRKTERAKK
jgi:N utilization substance protein B